MHELIVNFFHALKKACSVSSAMAYSVAAAVTLLIVIRAAGLKLPPWHMVGKVFRCKYSKTSGRCGSKQLPVSR